MSHPIINLFRIWNYTHWWSWACHRNIHS